MTTLQESPTNGISCFGTVAREEAISMISLDHALIARARILTTGANVHRVKQLIFVYEQAVILHNVGAARHGVFQQEHETELRQFTERENERRAIAKVHSQQLDQRNRAVMRHAAEAMKKAERAERHSEELEKSVNAALLLGTGAFDLPIRVRKKRRGANHCSKRPAA